MNLTASERANEHQAHRRLSNILRTQFQRRASISNLTAVSLYIYDCRNPGSWRSRMGHAQIQQPVPSSLGRIPPSTTCHQQPTIICMYAPCHHLLCGQIPVLLSNMLIECETFMSFARISGKTSLSPATATGPRRSDNVIDSSLYLDADIQMHEYSGHSIFPFVS